MALRKDFCAHRQKPSENDDQIIFSGMLAVISHKLGPARHAFFTLPLGCSQEFPSVEKG